jgi:hypothetical protein
MPSAVTYVSDFTVKVVAASLLKVMFGVCAKPVPVIVTVVPTGPLGVVVLPPPNFQPQVPPAFKVSVFAKGFTEPRWLSAAGTLDSRSCFSAQRRLMPSA